MGLGEIKLRKILKALAEYGNGDGYGDGDGDGDGSGYGSGNGYGDGIGYGDGSLESAGATVMEE